MDLYLYNTLTRKKEIFKPIHPDRVGMYTCGPTVYNFAHIGNLRTYIFEDILKRVLLYNGYKVLHVMNITDVGHLTSDADEGEDKIELSAKKERKNAWQIAEFYTEAFKRDIKKLNILEPDIWCKATEHIDDFIALIKILEEKGYTYRTSDGIYFDTSKLPDYGKLAGQNLDEILPGARVEVNPEKKNPWDFALWKFSPKDVKRQMEWDSPWGIGFPGWHIECSAMSTKYLGQPFDIHCGGVDHIAIHHTNEIAQSEAAYGKPMANYWLHGEFLIMGEKRMGKSEGNFITLSDLEERGYNPLAYRYFCLTAHYRSPLKFTWQAIDSAQRALNRMYENIKKYPATNVEYHKEYEERFHMAINDDLDMPKALAIAWELIRDESVAPEVKRATLIQFDKVFGLSLDNPPEIKIDVPDEIWNLLEEREKARKEKNYQLADEIRDEIKRKGYIIEDTPQGPRIKKAPTI
ncbi:MAG: cysteine--tRNA ligase [Dictyoglomus sp. NZ13-RE01]|nr:MAG: cysteine--tRNA ligase [Dictyoglomus sp. NZ13-RE01]